MKINNQSLPDQVYEYMMTGITAGRLAAGMKLSEEAICDELGVSRTPVREALLRLEQDGMLVRKPRCGYTVKEFKAREIEELYQCRRILECNALELGFDAIPAAQIDKLDDLIDKAIENTDINASMRVDEKLHQLIVDACPNRYLQDLTSQFVKRTRPFRLIRSYKSDDVHSISMERKNIIQAIKKKDQALAVKQLGNHILRGIADGSNK